MQRIDAIKAIAENLRDLYIDSTPASLTGSTLQFAALIQPLSGQLLGANAYIYSGGGIGQARVAGSFNPASNELVFPQGFGTTPSLNSSVIVTKNFTKSQYDNVLDRVIGVAKTRYLQETTGTMQFVGSQYEYPTPSGMTWISTIRLVPSVNTDYSADDEVDTIFEIPPRFFRIERNVGGSYLITIDPRRIDIGDSIDKELAKIIGQSPPDVAGTDNATIPSDLEEYVVSGATMQLSAQKAGKGNEWERIFYMHRDEIKGRGNALGLEEYINRSGRGRKVGS